MPRSQSNSTKQNPNFTSTHANSVDLTVCLLYTAPRASAQFHSTLNASGGKAYLSFYSSKRKRMTTKTLMALSVSTISNNSKRKPRTRRGEHSSTRSTTS